MESRKSTMDAITFQRRHYQFIAAIMLSEKPDRESGNRWSDGARDEWSTTVLAFASRLASTNPGFDRARFLAACGME